MIKKLLFLFFITVNTVFAFNGKVIGIVDGDTVRVLTDENQVIKVRLAEIDCPEKKQPWGKKSKQALSEIAYGQEVMLKPVTKDRYGRTIAHLFINELHINREMVRTGNAWVYRKYMTDASLLIDEEYARQNKLGLWALPESQRIEPWKWRRNNRK